MNLAVNILSALAWADLMAQRGRPNINGLSNSGGKAVTKVLVAEDRDDEALILKCGDLRLSFGGYAVAKGDFVGTPPIIKYKREKKIITTEVGEEGDEVVEQYGMKAWELDIQGLLVSQTHTSYPAAEIEKIRKAFEKPQEWDVEEGKILGTLGIYKLYMTHFTINGVIGYEDTWEYGIQAKSIKQSTFILKP